MTSSVSRKRSPTELTAHDDSGEYNRAPTERQTIFHGLRETLPSGSAHVA